MSACDNHDNNEKTVLYAVVRMSAGTADVREGILPTIVSTHKDLDEAYKALTLELESDKDMLFEYLWDKNDEPDLSVAITLLVEIAGAVRSGKTTWKEAIKDTFFKGFDDIEGIRVVDNGLIQFDRYGPDRIEQFCICETMI